MKDLEGGFIVSLLFSCSIMSDSLRPRGLQPARLLCLWDFLGKNTGVGCHFLLQGIFPTPGIEPASLKSPALVGGFFTPRDAGEAVNKLNLSFEKSGCTAGKVQCASFGMKQGICTDGQAGAHTA